MNTAMDLPVANPEVKRSFPAGLMLSLVYGIIAVLVLGVAWGLVSYFTNTIFLMGAILIGAIVSFALTAGFARVNWLVALMMFVPAVVFTFAAVLFGDFLYYTLVAAREFQISLPAAASEVAGSFTELITGPNGGAGSLIFAAIGSLAGFYFSVKK